MVGLMGVVVAMGLVVVVTVVVTVVDGTPQLTKD